MMFLFLVVSIDALLEYLIDVNLEIFLLSLSSWNLYLIGSGLYFTNDFDEIASLVAQLVKNPHTMRETWVWDLDLRPGLGRSPGEGKGYPLQYSGLENSMDCIDHGVAESDLTEWLSLYDEINLDQIWDDSLSQIHSFLSPFKLFYEMKTVLNRARTKKMTFYKNECNVNRVTPLVLDGREMSKLLLIWKWVQFIRNSPGNSSLTKICYFSSMFMIEHWPGFSDTFIKNSDCSLLLIIWSSFLWVLNSEPCTYLYCLPSYMVTHITDEFCLGR